VKDERAVFVFTYVDAIECKNAGVHIEPQGAVRPLDGKDNARVRIDDARESEDRLGAALERAAELADECARDFGAANAVFDVTRSNGADHP